MEEIISVIAPDMDFQTVSLLSTVAVVSIGAKVIGKAIPDDKKGALGFLRKAAKVVGLVLDNRKSSRPEKRYDDEYERNETARNVFERGRDGRFKAKGD